MVQTCDATMARNAKLQVSGIAESKKELLRILKGTMHFEKTLTAMSSMIGHARKSKLGLPAWFVQKFGDKFKKSVILRTESSPKSWPVKLTISFPSARGIQVVFSGGWRAFATFHGLMEGDSLVFALTAMSVFEVYIFPGARIPRRCPSPAPRMLFNNEAEVYPRQKAAEQFQDHRVEPNLAAEGIIEGLADHSIGLHLLESEIVLNSSSHDSNDGQEPALNPDKLMASGATLDDSLVKLQGIREV